MSRAVRGASPASISSGSLLRKPVAESAALRATCLSDSATSLASVPTLPSPCGKRGCLRNSLGSWGPTDRAAPRSPAKHAALHVAQELGLTGGKKDPGVAQEAGHSFRWPGLPLTPRPDPPDPQAFTPYQEQLPGYASPELQIFLCSVKYKPRNSVQKEISPRTGTRTKKENREHPQNLHKTLIT